MLRFLTRRGLERGLGGNRAWLVVGVAAGGARLLARLARRSPQIVYESDLEPGQTLVVEHRTATYSTLGPEPDSP